MGDETLPLGALAAYPAPWLSPTDIHRATHLWIQQHGDQATARARDMVEAMRHKGDDTWLRIVAIGTLSTPATEARQ